MTIVPVSATPKFAPEIATFAVRKRLRRWRTRGLGQSGRVVGERGVGGEADLAHLAHEDVADLGAVAVDRRHEDVARLVVAELHDQLREVGLPGTDPRLGERLVEADLLGGHRLDLDNIGLARGTHELGHDAVRFGRVPCPVHLAARCGDPLLELHEQLVEIRVARRT